MKMLTVALALTLVAVFAYAEDGKAPAPPEDPGAEKVKGGESEVKETASGIKYWVLKTGKGARPRAGDEVSVHYVGKLTNGKVFDSSLSRPKGFTFLLGAGRVIEGWDEGVALMQVGSKVRFLIPWKLAYGEAGSPPVIPPKADLVFEIELLAVKEGTPLPVFRKANSEKQVKTDSGLVYEVLAEGEGEAPRADQGVRIAFALFTREGKYIESTAASKAYLAGLRDQIRLGPTPPKFLREAVLLMKPGTRLRLEVPANLCWGERVIHPKIDPGVVTIWELEMVSVQDVPKFREPDAEKSKTTPSGLRYEVIRQGTGKKPIARNSVEVRYSGWTPAGKMFDSSHARGDTAIFPLTRVIPGWTEGLQLMSEGGIYLFRIPAKMAYGPRPPPGSIISPNSDLIFLVELVRLVK